MDDWLPGYERVTVTGCTGPGSYRAGYPWRWVAHTTESPAGSMPGIINLFQNQPCSTPHFAIDPATGRRVQFIPLGWSAAALRGGRGGVETNRAHCIQTEIIGYAKDQAGRSAAELDFIGDHVAAIVAAGVPLNLGHVHPTTGENGYGERGAVRMTPTQWRAFDGICGHSAVPFNDHWDPGRLDLAAVARRAAGTTPTPPVPEEDTVTPEQMTQLGTWMQEQRALTDKRIAELEAKVNALLLQLDPAGVAAGKALEPSEPYARQLLERVVNKTGA